MANYELDSVVSSGIILLAALKGGAFLYQRPDSGPGKHRPPFWSLWRRLYRPSSC